MLKSEMADIEHQVLWGLLVHGQVSLGEYTFKVVPTPGRKSVVLSDASGILMQEPLSGVMSVISHYLWLIRNVRV